MLTHQRKPAIPKPHFFRTISYELIRMRDNKVDVRGIKRLPLCLKNYLTRRMPRVFPRQNTRATQTDRRTPRPNNQLSFHLIGKMSSCLNKRSSLKKGLVAPGRHHLAGKENLSNCPTRGSSLTTPHFENWSRQFFSLREKKPLQADSQGP